MGARRGWRVGAQDAGRRPPQRTPRVDAAPRRARRRHVTRRGLILAVLALAGCGGNTVTQKGQSLSRHTVTHAAKTPPAHGPRRTAVPILMYHLVNAPPPGTAYPELWVPPAAFRAQIQALSGAGYRGV